MSSYQRVKAQYRALREQVANHYGPTMFYFKAEGLKPSQSFRLDDVFEKAKTAEQRGWRVVLEANNDGLRLRYEKKIVI